MKLYGLLQQGLAWAGEKLNWTRFQWQPTRTAHDPNPPITLENAAGGTPATALAAPGIVTSSSPAGKATGAAAVGALAAAVSSAAPAGNATGAAAVGALAALVAGTTAPGHAVGAQPAVTGGGVFGPGRVGVSYPQIPRPARPVSRAAVARAAPGRAFSEVPPGRATGVVSIPGTARAAPGEGRTQSAPGRAIGVGRGHVVASYGAAIGTAAPGRAAGAATVIFRGVDAIGVAAPGGARAGATVFAQAAEARSSVSPGSAIGRHNPTDEELAAFALLLDDLVRIAA